MAAKPPDHHHHHIPAVSPTTSSTSLLINQSPPSKLPIDFSPPLIAMVVVAAAAFLLVTYSRLISRHIFPPFLRLLRRYRRWRRLRRLRRAHFPPSDLGSPPPPYESSDGFYVYSPYGLDESVIKTIPLTIFELPKSNNKLTSKLGLKIEEEFNDCAVCLLEFEDGDYIRTLPLCSHSFHVDCIDMWLRSHATCPLCRSGVFLPPPIVDSPLTPLMASRIRPSLDEGFLLESIFLEPLPEGPEQNSGEIQPVIRSDDFFSTQSEDHRPRKHDFLLKRSYSFGFERSFPSERIVLEPATTPYHHNRRRSFFWTKRPSSSTPFSSIAKSRVFSFRLKSPGGFFRRKTFFPFSESSASFRTVVGNGSSSSRRMKFLASPLFGRHPAPAMFSSSRMRCGDPEALLSPERYRREVNI